MEHGSLTSRPRVAIVDPNTLAAVGLKQLLQNVMPIMTIDIYGSLAELEAKLQMRLGKAQQQNAPTLSIGASVQQQVVEYNTTITIGRYKKVYTKKV